MAAALAELVDPDIEHGAVEALFTVDEEPGLTGAFELADDMITGKYHKNLDSEDYVELIIGCSVVVDTLATLYCSTEAAPANYTFYRADVSDLLG